MSSWPSSLPEQGLWDSYEETPQNGTIRSSMDTGPAKVRRRFTATVQRFSLVSVLTADEVSTLLTFYESTLTEGTSTFDWIHPRKQTSMTCRFIEKPIIRDMQGGRDYMVTLRVEVLP